MSPDDYEFSFKEYLIDRTTKPPTVKTRYAALEIVPQDDRATEFVVSVWDYCKLAVFKHHEALDAQEIPKWCRDNVRDKFTKKPPPEQLRFAAWHGDTMMGFIHIRPNFPSQLSPGSNVAYVDYVAVAPWHMDTPFWQKRVTRVGSALLAFATMQSFLIGLEGRIGLHATGPEAESFYDGLNVMSQKRHGMALFSLKKTDVGGPQRPNGYVPDKEKNYYESGGPACMAFLGEFKP